LKVLGLNEPSVLGSIASMRRGNKETFQTLGELGKHGVLKKQGGGTAKEGNK